MDAEFKILCNTCKEPVGIVVDSEPEIVACPVCGLRAAGCGLRAPLDEAMTEIAEQTFDESLSAAFDGLRNTRSPFFEISVNKPEKRTFRFIRGE